MARSAFWMLIALAVQVLMAFAAPTASPISFLVPTSNGGSLLDDAGSGVGEPLNVCLLSSRLLSIDELTVWLGAQVIISGASSPDVLTDDGFTNFARAAGMYVHILSLPRFLGMMWLFLWN